MLDPSQQRFQLGVNKPAELEGPIAKCLSQGRLHHIILRDSDNTRSFPQQSDGQTGSA